MNIFHQTIKLKNNEAIFCMTTDINPHLPNILLLHGNFSSSLNWLPTMKALNNKFNVFAIDLRGFGNSSYNYPIYSLVDLAQEMILLIDKLQLRDLTVIGWSTAGGIALEIAREIPNKIKQIVLLSSIGLKGYDFLDSYPTIPTLFSWSSSPFMNNPFLFADPISNLSIQQLIFNPISIKQFLDQYLYHKRALHPDFEKQIINQILKQRNFIDLSKALTSYRFKPFNQGAKSYQGPIHIWHGILDRVIPLNTARSTASYFGPQAQLKIYEKSGHAIMNDQFKLFIQEIENIASPVME